MCRHGAAAGASGAVDTAGGAITAESALSDARASAGDEQSHRKLQSPTADSYQMACNEVKSDCSAPNTYFFGLIKGKKPSAQKIKECEDLHRALKAKYRCP
ncbi:unnamed protein product [Closterium sp. NIES-65]|nr:unnamed protein product [Closterium sp. NIES-65]